MLHDGPRATCVAVVGEPRKARSSAPGPKRVAVNLATLPHRLYRSQTFWTYVRRRVLLTVRSAVNGGRGGRRTCASVRVALFTECYRPIVNGVVGSIDALRDGLHARGVEVITIAPHAPRFTDTDADIVRIPSLPLPTSTGYRLCVPYLGARRRRRVGAIDVVHAHSPFVTGAMAASFARRHRLPLVFTYHTRLDAYAHYAPFESGATRQALIALTRRYANAAATVIAPTAAIERRLREIGVVVPIAVVPSAIDVTRFAAGRRSAEVRAQLGAAANEPLVLAVARLGREKNLELALDALALLPDARLAIVGDGPHRDALERRAADVGIGSRVRFAGPIAHELLPDVYASADAFAFTSLTDTQGLVLAEALAAGLPIVAAESDASRDVVGPAGNVVAAAPAAFAAALRDGLAAGPEQSAVHLAHSRFTVEAQTRRIIALYEGLVAANPA